MAAVIGRQGFDEGRLPGGGKAAEGLDRCDAAEGGIDKQEPACGVEDDFMGIDIAGDQADGRHVEAIAALVAEAWCEVVVEAPELVAGGHPEAVACGKEAHGAIKEALMQLELAFWGEAKKEQAVGAVGGEGKRQLLELEPGSELGRGVQTPVCGSGS